MNVTPHPAAAQANLSAMVNNRLGLLLDDDTAQLQAAATRLRQLLPDINVDKWVGQGVA